MVETFGYWSKFFIGKWVTLSVNFRWKETSPSNLCLYQKTSVITLSCGTKIAAVCPFVSSQSTCVTDGQTDWLIDGQTELQSQYLASIAATRGKIPALSMNLQEVWEWLILNYEIFLCHQSMPNKWRADVTMYLSTAVWRWVPFQDSQHFNEMLKCSSILVRPAGLCIHNDSYSSAAVYLMTLCTQKQCNKFSTTINDIPQQETVNQQLKPSSTGKTLSKNVKNLIQKEWYTYYKYATDLQVHWAV